MALIVCNQSKTFEFVVFDRNKRHQELSLSIGNINIKTSDSIKVLGAIFQNDMRWSKQVNKVISNANSMFLPLKYIHRHLTQSQLKSAIFAHFISRLMFASPVWGKSILSTEKHRIETNMNRVVRLLTNRELSNRELYINHGMRSFISMCTISDCSMLYKLCTALDIDPQCERLLSQCTTSSWFPGKITFYDYSRTRVDKSSFINCSKDISELIPFEWMNLSPSSFTRQLKAQTPFYSTKAKFILSNLSNIIN